MIDEIIDKLAVKIADIILGKIDILPPRQKGVVKKCFENNGFITADDGQEYYISFMDVLNQKDSGGYSYLEEGQSVEFTIGKNSRGIAAKEVMVINV